MRRNPEKSFKNNLKFISIDGSLFIYPYAFTVEKPIKNLLKEREKSSERAKFATFIQNEVKEMKDQLPWPPQPGDLHPEKNFICRNTFLGQFWGLLITGQKSAKQMNSRSARLRLSLV